MARKHNTHEIRCSQTLKKKDRAGKLRPIVCGAYLARVVVDPVKMEVQLKCRNCKHEYVIDMKPSFANYSVRKVAENPDLSQKIKEKQNA